MEQLPLRYTRLIDKYKPVDVEGFTLYPITVEHYEEYLVASQAIGFMQQKLSVQLMSMPILAAFFKMDLERAIQGEPVTGLYTSALLSIVLALRLAQDDESGLEACKRLVPLSDKDDPTKLKALAFVEDAQTGKTRTITPYQYENMRRVIAAQNGIEIPDTMDNPELVEAEHDLAEKKALKLDAKITDMVCAMSVMTGKEEEEIYGWAVLKLTRQLASCRRILDYMVCGISEGSGASWKGGNPVPHPFFDRKKEGTGGLIKMEEFAGGEGLKAMQDAGAV